PLRAAVERRFHVDPEYLRESRQCVLHLHVPKTRHRHDRVGPRPNQQRTGVSECGSGLINCALEGISPVGWGAMGGDTTNMHYWEYNSTNLSDGKPADDIQTNPAP